MPDFLYHVALARFEAIDGETMGVDVCYARNTVGEGEWPKIGSFPTSSSCDDLACSPVWRPRPQSSMGPVLASSGTSIEGRTNADSQFSLGAMRSLFDVRDTVDSPLTECLHSFVPPLETRGRHEVNMYYFDIFPPVGGSQLGDICFLGVGICE